MLHHAAGLIADVFRVPRIIAGPGGAASMSAAEDSTRLQARPTRWLPPVHPRCVCDVTITDFAGSKTSSLCSPLVRSTSAETPMRKWSGPSSGSSVDAILFCNALLDGFSIIERRLRRIHVVALARLGEAGSAGCRWYRPARPGRPRVRARRWRSTGRSPRRSAAKGPHAWRSFTSTLALAGWRGLRVQGILGQRQMNARRLHFADGHHGAFQLAFNRAMIIDLFGELASAEIGFVEQLKSDAAGFGQPRRGHLQAHFGDFVGGN